MDDVERERLRATFAEDAERYDRCRPGYPAAVFDVLPVRRGTRVLEIGCGTGQATLPLARRGCAVTAIELGTDLAAVARQKLQGFPEVDVVVGAFEEWPLPPEPFDVVVAATSFHWLDPAVRMAKTADALKPGGSLAVVSTHHVEGGTSTFFAEVQECYERFDPATPPGLRLPEATEISQDDAEFRAGGRFGPVRFHRFEWEAAYTADEYVDLLCTYSPTLALPADAREDLLTCIRRRIEERYGGAVRKRYLTQVALAAKDFTGGR